MFLFQPLCGAADPEWKATEANRHTLREQESTGAKRHSNNYATKTDVTDIDDTDTMFLSKP